MKAEKAAYKTAAATIPRRAAIRRAMENSRNAAVVVEAGVTWRALKEALDAKGVRTPYFGPMSGSHATVGGGMSQGAIFHGSARYGCSADVVLGLSANVVKEDRQGYNNFLGSQLGVKGALRRD